MLNLRNLTNRELSREIAHARNCRDAYAIGRVPQEVTNKLYTLLGEQDRRMIADKVKRNTTNI